MVEITLKWDTSQVRFLEAKGAGAKRALMRAVRSGGRDAIRAARTDFRRYVQTRKRFKVRTINEALKIDMPTSGVDVEQLVWRMRVSSRPVSLAEFPHRQGKHGVSVGVNKGGKRMLVKGAFTATMPNGTYGIWRRIAQTAHGPMTKKISKSTDFFRVGRLPIERQFSTRISDVFQDHGVPERLFERAQISFASTLDRVLALELAKLG